METQADQIWKDFFKNRNLALRDKLMVKYLGLVHYVVNKLFKSVPASVDREDLINIGVIGLSESLDRFDPYFGIKFETYAIPRIKGAIIDELRKQDWIPRSLRSKSNKIKKTLKKLEQTRDQDLSDHNIATHIGISEKEYNLWQSQLKGTMVLSLDKANPNYDDNNLYGVIEDTSVDNPLQLMEDEELKILLVKVIKKLSEKTRLAITLYYFEKLTFKEIGEILNVSESRISQIHADTIKKLKKMLKREYIDEL
jgi:RNA polymerase sigma factor for flagellar operon FliA